MTTATGLGPGDTVELSIERLGEFVVPAIAHTYEETEGDQGDQRFSPSGQ